LEGVGTLSGSPYMVSVGVLPTTRTRMSKRMRHCLEEHELVLPCVPKYASHSISQGLLAMCTTAQSRISHVRVEIGSPGTVPHWHPLSVVLVIPSVTASKLR